MISVDKIVSQIVELSLKKSSDDPVRNIYSVSVEIGSKICEVMRLIRVQERTTQ